MQNIHIIKRKNIKQRGITLIALVITIIVLLILAGISIQMLTGENSILTQAGRARERMQETQKEEEVKIAVLGSYENGNDLNINKLEKSGKWDGSLFQKRKLKSHRMAMD